MNYELAKELKDAGFPQMEGIEKCEHRMWDNVHGTPCECGEYAYIPTLEFLIDMCAVGKIIRENNKWYTYDLDRIHTTSGISPKDAVAQLWLRINKKI